MKVKELHELIPGNELVHIYSPYESGEWNGEWQTYGNEHDGREVLCIYLYAGFRNDPRVGIIVGKEVKMREVFEVNVNGRNWSELYGDWDEYGDIEPYICEEFDTHEEARALIESITPDMAVGYEIMCNTNGLDVFTIVRKVNDNGEYEGEFDVVDEYVWVGAERMEV